MMDERQPISDEPLTDHYEIGSLDGETPSQASEPIPDSPQPALTIGARLRRWLGIRREAQNKRLTEFNRAIAMYPDAAVNYVLRGEVYAELGEYTLAQADFEYGLMLAEAQFETSDWGFMAQTLRDRALVGLEKTRRRLKT